MRARGYLIVLPPLLAALFLGIFLAPNSKEMALMQSNGSDSDKSLQTFIALHSQGDNSISVLAPLINLHLHYGDVEEAIALLESYVADNPRNVEGRKRLAKLYKASQRYYEYCLVLEELQTLSPSTETLRELADTYDFLGEYKNEMNTLARIVKLNRDNFFEEDYVKLAKFYRIDGRPAAAIEIMDHLLDKKDFKVALDTLCLAMQILLENGNEGKAFSVATSSLKKQPKEENALKLSELFQMNDKIDLAYEVLGPFLANIENSPRLEQQMVGLLFAQKKLDDIFALLSGQFARNRLPNILAETLIDLAQNRKDYSLMEAVLRKVDLNEISAQALLRYTDLSISQNKQTLAQIIESRIGADRLEYDEPLLAAMLWVAIDDTPESLSALAALPLDDITLPDERMVVARVLLTHGQTKRVQVILEDLSVLDVMRALDPIEYALLYLDSPDSAAKAEQRLETISSGDIPVELRTKVAQARLFIETGLGHGDRAELWFKEHPEQASANYSDAFGIASRFHHEDIALNIARRLYRAEPTQANREQLIDTLLTNRRYAEVLTYLQTDIGKDPKAKTSNYIDILSEWAHSSKNANENVVQMQKYVEFALRHLQLGKKEQHDMAYLLQETGFRLEAEGLLVNLAAGKSFTSSEVQEILSFWGETPPPSALVWIKSRASAAMDSERLQWLTHLNSINHPEAVIEVVQDRTEDAPASLMDIYIEALVSTRSPKLREVLSQEIEYETDVTRLKRLVLLTEQEGIQNITEKGWRKLYSLNPDDSDALKFIALQEANAKHYSAALPLLKRYLKDNPDDYQINYAYAGILQHQQKKSEAKPFYDKAYSQLAELKEKTLSDRLSMAHLLYLSKGLTESADLFRELIKEYPDNKSLRADFAEILLENKQYDEASVILSP